MYSGKMLASLNGTFSASIKQLLIVWIAETRTLGHSS